MDKEVEVEADLPGGPALSRGLARGMTRITMQPIYHCCLELTLHTVAVSWMLGCIKILEMTKNWLWPEKKLLWDFLPISYIFDTMDAVALVAFLAYGSYNALLKLIKND